MFFQHVTSIGTALKETRFCTDCEEKWRQTARNLMRSPDMPAILRLCADTPCLLNY